MAENIKSTVLFLQSVPLFLLFKVVTLRHTINTTDYCKSLWNISNETVSPSFSNGCYKLYIYELVKNATVAPRFTIAFLLRLVGAVCAVPFITTRGLATFFCRILSNQFLTRKSVRSGCNIANSWKKSVIFFPCVSFCWIYMHSTYIWHACLQSQSSLMPCFSYERGCAKRWYFLCWAMHNLYLYVWRSLQAPFPCLLLVFLFQFFSKMKVKSIKLMNALKCVEIFFLV